MHNHTEFCNAHYVKNADYIKFPFSASTVGPRVGAAALDMVGAALKVVNKGESAMNFGSGVDFFDPEVLTLTLTLTLTLALTLTLTLTLTRCSLTTRRGSAARCPLITGSPLPLPLRYRIRRRRRFPPGSSLWSSLPACSASS